MTKIIESITVEVQCIKCDTRANATIVSTTERGDLILVPIGWKTEVNDGQIEVFCPNHKEKQ